jgi:hypothetical protein
MLYAYDKDSGTLLPCKPTEFKTQGFTERFDMEKWVAADPSVLTGEDLMVITTEFGGFDKTNERLDVLAIDTDGQLVVVELKRDDSGKNVDLQALKYAAYCSAMTLEEVARVHVEYQSRSGIKLTTQEAEASIREFIANEEFAGVSDTPRIMLVAREYRNEVTASVKWLRDKHGIDITCIKWDVYELPDGKVVVDTSTLIPQPETREFEIRVQNKEKTERRLTPRVIATNEFFARCAALLSEQTQGDYAAPRNQSYYQIPTSIPSVHYEWAFHGRPRSSMGVELHFERGGGFEKNRALCAACEEHVETLQQTLGETVLVSNPWGTRWARIYIERPECEMDDDLAEWAVSKMVIMMKTMQPILDGLPIE